MPVYLTFKNDKHIWKKKSLKQASLKRKVKAYAINMHRGPHFRKLNYIFTFFAAKKNFNKLVNENLLRHESQKEIISEIIFTLIQEFSQ